ncbi:MAG TPA: GxxExxY protein, partial [Puia sp.]|nr:GxxExxY protein [Puia sp.]
MKTCVESLSADASHSVNCRMEKMSLSGSVIGAAMKVHSKLGPGLLESVYVQCLGFELTKIGLEVQIQKPIPLVYDEI